MKLILGEKAGSFTVNIQDFFICLPISTEARAIEKIRVSYFHIAYSLTLAIKKVLKEERKNVQEESEKFRLAM